MVRRMEFIFVASTMSGVCSMIYRKRAPSLFRMQPIQNITGHGQPTRCLMAGPWFTLGCFRRYRTSMPLFTWSRIFGLTL